MTRIEIENQVVQTLQQLPLEKVQELLDFALFLRTRAQEEPPPFPQPRPLGLLQGKATCLIGEDFSITDEELLRL
jgi:hypothetical protein